MADELTELEPEVIPDGVSEYDLLFPVIPVEDDPYPPDEAGTLGLLDDIEDFAEIELDVEVRAEQLVREPAFDWATNEFFVRLPPVISAARTVATPARDPQLAEGDDAMIEWVLKALHTPRDEYPVIYPPKYGCNLKKLLGQRLAEPVIYSEAARMAREAVLFHPRISRCDINEVRREPAMPDVLFLTLTFWIDGHGEPVYLEAVV